jgi:hypothetical protein
MPVRTRFGAVIAAVVLVAAGTGAWAQPQSTSPITARAVADAFLANGVQSSVGTDDYGDPFVELRPSDGLQVDFGSVVFWDCDSAGVCDSILMQAGWRPQRRPVYLDKINEWNVQRRWVRAYIDADNYIIVDMDVSGYGGVSEEALALQVSRFVGSVVEFGTFLEQ